jgi:hypothetical protein
MARKKSAQQVEAVAASDEASLSVAPAEVSASDELVAAPVTAWRVAKACRAYLFGLPVNLAAGKLVTVAAYGDAAIQRLKDQGVTLEPV